MAQPENFVPRDLKTRVCNKSYPKGNVKRNYACLLAKGFTKRKRALTTKQLSPLSLKDYFRTILTLVAYFYFEQLQIYFKIVFQN